MGDLPTHKNHLCLWVVLSYAMMLIELLNGTLIGIYVKTLVQSLRDLSHTFLSTDNFETVNKHDVNTLQSVSLTDTTVNNLSDKLPTSFMYTAIPIKGIVAEIEHNDSSSFNKQSLVFRSFHQAHQLSSVNSLGNQCTCNALCSLIYTKLPS